ncbi:MAG: NAD-dependent histone deacetylase sir2 [Pycnora praestabilis]|nr:MAG: NAD-dependent histone deacetylase sir2 [Pycnora praestabilis]
MAKTKPAEKSKKSNKSILNGTTVHRKRSSKARNKDTPETLLMQSLDLLHTSQPEEALPLAQRALARLQPTSTPTEVSIPALNLLAEINIELGDIDTAREYFLTAVSLDPIGSLPEEEGGGAEKFLWLAQICEEGGAESVRWFERGAGVLRRDIEELESSSVSPNVLYMIEEKKRKLANALCGVVEVYMTDLSWEEDVESRCELLVTEALLVAPNAPEPLQTLASVRISQERLEDARAALSRSMDLWIDLPPEDPSVPEFPTRVSLARLLIESEMEQEAMDVLERLVEEDDSSVEAWYLGGWCLYIMGEKRRKDPSDPKVEGTDEWKEIWRSGRDWLETSLKLCQKLEYEDDRLRDHAVELTEQLNKDLIFEPDKGRYDVDIERDNEWEDEDEDEGQEKSDDQQMHSI